MNTLPRIKRIEALPNYRLNIVFDDGREVVYNVSEDIEQIEEFRMLKQIPHLWEQVQVDCSRTCVYWNDRIELPSDTLYEYGVVQYGLDEDTIPHVAEE
ncbi:MAG: DUF2442 domain-containing protein [Bacteroidales bacterium]|nr:DUF2442 domain-containing protein [Bacteroidales bacterium]